MNRSILLVFAHPDDESFGLAGTIGKYSSQGVPVDLICATRGEKGTRVGLPDSVETGVAREAELRCAARETGIHQLYFLDYIDGELERLPFDMIVGRVRDLMRKIEPGIVITFGHDGITGHPDHVTIGKAATEAFKQLEHDGKLYYVAIPASLMAGEEGSGLATMPDDEISTAIDVSGFADRKIRAIACHQSQQDAHDFLDSLRDEGESAWLRTEHLYLALPRLAVKETDLFASASLPR